MWEQGQRGSCRTLSYPHRRQAEVAGLEAQLATLSAAADAGSSSSSSGAAPGSPSNPAAAAAASVAAAELDAREAERQRWAAIVERERETGERRIAEVRAACRAQYGQLVRTLESRHVAEFEAALASIAGQAAAEREETAAVERRLADVRAALAAARAEQAALASAAKHSHAAGAEEGEEESENA